MKNAKSRPEAAHSPDGVEVEHKRDCERGQRNPKESCGVHRHSKPVGTGQICKKYVDHDENSEENTFILRFF